ncbi:hypothetical protein HDU83_000779 [Entophlyctis luteolus]|nr:hypothetical protein HDU83_000779 [Entophlyctis luteolus]
MDVPSLSQVPRGHGVTAQPVGMVVVVGLALSLLVLLFCEIVRLRRFIGGRDAQGLRTDNQTLGLAQRFEALNAAVASLDAAVTSLNARVEPPVNTILMQPMLNKNELDNFLSTNPKYKLCNGDALDKTEYSKLYSIIGDLYGSSLDTFNLPNVTDCYLLGGPPENCDSAAIRRGGSLNFHTYASVDIQTRTSEDGVHDHTTIDHNSNWYVRKMSNSGGPCTIIDSGVQDPKTARTGNGGSHSHSVHVNGSVNVHGSIEPPYFKMHVFIKVK